MSKDKKKVNMKDQGLGQVFKIADQIFDRLISEARDETSIPIELEEELFKRAAKKAGLNDFYIPPTEIFRLRRTLGRESDRGCALAAAAYLDGELEKLLRGFFVDNTNVVDELFGPAGPLSSFSARTDLAYCLGLISGRARRDLHLIRKVRNNFAHRSEQVTFEDPEIRDRCRELYHDVSQEQFPPRRKFMRVTIGVAAAIHFAVRMESRRNSQREIDTQSAKSEDISRKLDNAIKVLFARTSKPKGTGSR